MEIKTKICYICGDQSIKFTSTPTSTHSVSFVCSVCRSKRFNCKKIEKTVKEMLDSKAFQLMKDKKHKELLKQWSELALNHIETIKYRRELIKKIGAKCGTNTEKTKQTLKAYEKTAWDEFEQNLQLLNMFLYESVNENDPHHTCTNGTT